MFKINKLIILAPVVLVLFMATFTSVLPAFAQEQQGTYLPLAPLPNTTSPGGATTLPVYIKGIFALLIGVAAVLAVIMIVIGGVQYMSTDAISGKSEGKEKITQALYGLLLAISCWLILYTINPNLLNFNVLDTIPTYYGTTPPPTEAGWYVRYQRHCPIGTGGWEIVTGYRGPHVDEQTCRQHMPPEGSFQVEVCGNPPVNATYTNFTCILREI